MKPAQEVLRTYQHAHLREFVREDVKYGNRAAAAAGLRFWAEAQNTGEKPSQNVEVPSNDALARLAEGYAT